MWHYVELDNTEGALLPWIIRGGTMAGNGALSNAASNWNNGRSRWTLVRAAESGFAVEATGGVASKWLSNRK
jgi:hypothetical protein